MRDTLSIRSILFTPAMRIDRLSRALTLGADVCLVDLEDSVGPADKLEARDRLCDFLDAHAHVSTPLAVRINALDSEHGLEDLLALKYGRRHPRYIVVPKTESAEHLAFVRHALGEAARHIHLIALIETAMGIQQAHSIAAAPSQASAFMFGSADYTRSIGAEINWDTLLLPRSTLAAAAGRAGIGAIDTPFFDIEDLDGLAHDCLRVKQLGFTGRCVIHPSQIEAVHAAFAPTVDAIERAERIVAAAKVSGGNICKVDGQMVGAPIIAQAHRTLAQVRRLTPDASVDTVEGART